MSTTNSLANLATGTTLNTQNATIYTQPTTTNNLAGMWNSTRVKYPSTMKFTIGDTEVEFNEREILRLREMLTEYIHDKHPEDLL